MGAYTSKYIFERRTAATDAWQLLWCDHVALTREFVNAVASAGCARPIALELAAGSMPQVALDKLLVNQRDIGTRFTKYTSGDMTTKLAEHVVMVSRIVLAYQRGLCLLTNPTGIERLAHSCELAALIAAWYANGRAIATLLHEAHESKNIAVGDADAMYRSKIKPHLDVTLAYATLRLNAQRRAEMGLSSAAEYDGSIDEFLAALRQTLNVIAPAFAGLEIEAVTIAGGPPL